MGQIGREGEPRKGPCPLAGPPSPTMGGGEEGLSSRTSESAAPALCRLGKLLLPQTSWQVWFSTAPPPGRDGAEGALAGRWAPWPTEIPPSALNG